ncbi:hypothetical protein BKA63DRAFT_208472 [Paraphoma chrysanthemicola]|nr:hypothetical protein BKA63DRAFT_208472 [Paraphoma chrysanthemicola]
MQNLPTEILLNIAGRLEKQDLLALALAKKSFTNIAQDVLYRSPTIIHSLKGGLDDNRMTALLHTLVKKPGLAQLVHSIELYGQLRKASLAHDINPYQPQTYMLGLICDDVIESAIIRKILDRLPKLERLVLELRVEDISGREKYDISDFPMLDKFLRLQRELAGIPGLENLKELYVEAQHVEAAKLRRRDAWRKQGVKC